MTDLENFINTLKAAGKTEIGSDDESKNLSNPQLEILTGLLFKYFTDVGSSIIIPATGYIKYGEILSKCLISQNEKDCLELANYMKKEFIAANLELIKQLLKG